MIFGNPNVGTDLRLPPALRPKRPADSPAAAAKFPMGTQLGLFGNRPPYMTPGIGDQHNRDMYGEGHPFANAGNLPAQTLNAQESAPGHWSIEGFDQMRQQMPRLPQQTNAGPPGPLGGSMREPFDYAEALAKLQGPQKKFGLGRFLLAGLADAFSGRPMMVPWLVQQRAAQEGRNLDAQQQLLGWQYKDHARQNEADLRASNPFTIGRARVQYNPNTGQTQELYRGPQDFELYAQQLGLEPGTDDYFQAVEDYVLRSSGPSAHDRDLQLDDYRTGNDQELENLRYGNRVGLENLRQGNRRGMVDYRNSNPPPSRSRGGRSTSGQRTFATPREAAKGVGVGETFLDSNGVERTMTAEFKRKYGG